MGRIIKLFILAVFIYLGFLFIGSDFFIIKNIKIEGNYDLLQQDIVSKFEYLKGENIFLINPRLIQREIGSDIRVEDINVTRYFPDTININIEQRKPIAIVYKNKQYLYVDEKLNIFAYYNEFENNNFPIITLDEENEEAENKMIEILKEVSKSDFFVKISEIYPSDNNYNIVLLDGTKILIDENVKTKKYNLAYKVYEKEIKNKQLEYIDLRFKDIVVK